MIELKFSHERPKEPGFFMRRMKAHGICSEQDPHCVKVIQCDDGLVICDYGLFGYEEFALVSKMAPEFEYAGPIAVS